MIDLVSPTRTGQLVLGGLYNLTGSTEVHDQIPVQVFRLESINRTLASVNEILCGTLWWKLWVAGRWFSGVNRDHQLATHQVGIGAGQTGKHGLHLERIERWQVRAILSDGRAYADYLQDTMKQDPQKSLVLP